MKDLLAISAMGVVAAILSGSGIFLIYYSVMDYLRNITTKCSMCNRRSFKKVSVGNYITCGDEYCNVAAELQTDMDIDNFYKGG